jgi:hypothetical protein
LEIINDYKKEANDIIKDYSSGNFNKEPIQEGFFGLHKNGGDNQWWKGEAHLVADKWVKEHLPEDLVNFIKSDKDLNSKCFTANNDKYVFPEHSNGYEVANSGWIDDYIYDTITKGFLLYHSDEIEDPSEFESLFEKHKDSIPDFDIVNGISKIGEINGTWSIAYRVCDDEYILFNDKNSSHIKDEEIKLGKSWTKFMERLTDSDEDDIQQEGFLDIFKPKPSDNTKQISIQTLDDLEEFYNIELPKDFKTGYEKLYDTIGNKTIKIDDDINSYDAHLLTPQKIMEHSGPPEILREGGLLVVIELNPDDWIALNISDGKYYFDTEYECNCDHPVFENFKEFKKCLTSEHPTFTLKNQKEPIQEVE